MAEIEGSLNAAGVTHVVILGHEVNCCVKQTAVGGKYKPSSDFVAGATGNGFTVMTCDAVLSSNRGAANWKQTAGVEFYSGL